MTLRPSPPSTPVQEAADRLVAASRDHHPCAPVRDLVAPDDVADAYRIQRLVNQWRIDAGARVIGRKIGLTSPAVQRQLGVDRPDFGVLFDDMQYADGATVSMATLLQPKVEAEIAFVLGTDLADPDRLDPDSVRRAVRQVIAAVEIVDSRVAGWDITFADTVADNASSGLFVLGTRGVPLEDFAPIEAEMTMAVNGEVVSSGNGRACLGDPLLALVWLARTAAELGDPLVAGQVVLSGALGPMVAVSPGDRVEAHIDGLDTVSFAFADGSAA